MLITDQVKLPKVLVFAIMALYLHKPYISLDSKLKSCYVFSIEECIPLSYTFCCTTFFWSKKIKSSIFFKFAIANITKIVKRTWTKKTT
jgi:hypothetical protein